MYTDSLQMATSTSQRLKLLAAAALLALLFGVPHWFIVNRTASSTPRGVYLGRMGRSIAGSWSRYACRTKWRCSPLAVRISAPPVGAPTIPSLSSRRLALCRVTGFTWTPRASSLPIAAAGQWLSRFRDGIGFRRGKSGSMGAPATASIPGTSQRFRLKASEQS